MSVVRWGVDGSDVYVFYNTNGMIECCGCDLHDAKVLEDETIRFWAHLKRHVERGDCVPEWVLDEFAPY